MDILTPIALIAFLAQVLIWFGLPDAPSNSTVSAAVVEAEPMPA